MNSLLKIDNTLLERDILRSVATTPVSCSLLTDAIVPICLTLWRTPLCLQTLYGIAEKMPSLPQHVRGEYAALSFDQQMRLTIARGRLPAAPPTELELLGDGHTLRSFVRRAAVTDTVRRKNGIPKQALSFAEKLFVLLA